MTTEPNSKTKRDAAIGCSVLAIVFIVMLEKSWRRWPGLVIDFGPQLYMPWQISKGAVMYRDFHYMVGGPLSQHYHALIFTVFGASFTALAVSNLLLIAFCIGLIYWSFYRHADQLTAITAGVFALVAFAFANFTLAGIFNFVTPYCAEVTHGIILSAVTTLLLSRWVLTGNRKFSAAAGLGAGMVLLTKPELFVAVLVAVCAGIFLFWRIHREESLIKPLGCMAAAGILPGLFFLGWFLCHEDLKSSVNAVFAAWVPLLTTSAADSPYYRWCLGLDNPGMHAHQISTQFLWLIAVLIACSLVTTRKLPPWLSTLLSVLLAYRMTGLIFRENVYTCGYCLPPICLMLLAILLWRGFKTGWSRPVVFATLWTIWSLAAAAKMGLFCRIWHYGFALGLPAFMAAIYFLLWELPNFLERFTVRQPLFKFLISAMLCSALFRAYLASDVIYSSKTLPVGSGSDLIYGFNEHFVDTDKIFLEALTWIESRKSADSTMAVLPQGAIFNYLMRLPNPSGYVAWNPPEIAAFGLDKMTGALTNSSPSYVVEVSVNYSEYNMGYFGTTKALGLDAQKWIEANYDMVKHVGHEWLKDNGFGIKIYQKKKSLHAGAGGTLGEFPARLDFADRSDL